MPASITDLKVLHNFLLYKKLKYRIGRQRTRADGNCFLDMLLQNMRHLSAAGKWNKNIPASVHEVRSLFIDYMKANRQEFVGYKDSDGRFVGGALDADMFENLIENQSQKNAYTDEEGFFVLAACKCLNIELVIVVTSIDSPIIQSGMGGPVQRINSGSNRPVFCSGLIRNEEVRTGHYQFIHEHEDGEPESFTMPVESNTLLFQSQSQSGCKIKFLYYSKILF